MSVNPFSAQGTITADAWGTGKRNDCYWNIAKNQLGEGASTEEIKALTEELIALNNEKAGKAGQRDIMIKDEQAVFLPLEYAMDEIKENVTNAQTAYTETTAKVSEMQGKFTEATTAVNSSLTGLNTATGEMQAAQAALEGASEGDDNYASLQSALSDAEAKFQEALTAYQDAIAAQQEAQNELNTATEELETLAQNLQEFQQELQETMDEYNEEKEEYGEELNQLQQEVDNLTQQTQNVETELQNAKTAQENAQTDIVKTQETVNTVFTTNEEGEMELNPDALKTAAENITAIPEGEVPGANQGNLPEVGEGDTVTDNGDGTVTVTHADGITETMKQDENGNWVADGTPGDEGAGEREIVSEKRIDGGRHKEIKYSDGSTEIVDNDGNVLESYPAEGTGEAAGTPYSFKEGDTVVENGDGTSTVTHADGTTEILTRDDNGNLVSKGEADPQAEGEEGQSEDQIAEMRNEAAVARAQALHAAMDRAGTDEDVVKEILNSVTGQDLLDVMSQYKEMFGKDLEDAIKGDFSFLSGQDRLLNKLDNAQTNASFIPRENIEKNTVLDAKLTAFKAATSNRNGTDEKVLNDIITQMNSAELKEFIEYAKNNNVDVASVIKSETSFTNEDMLLEKVTNAQKENGFKNDTKADGNAQETRNEEQLRQEMATTRAQALHAAMDRAGTDEDVVENILKSVTGQDLLDVMGQYKELYGKDLEDAIKGDFSFLSGQDRLLGKLDNAQTNASFIPRETASEEALRELHYQAFKAATTNRNGTDEKTVFQMLQNGSMSNADILALNERLKQDGTSLINVIKSEFSGKSEQALLDRLKTLGIDAE